MNKNTRRALLGLWMVGCFASAQTNLESVFVRHFEPKSVDISDAQIFNACASSINTKTGIVYITANQDGSITCLPAVPPTLTATIDPGDDQMYDHYANPSDSEHDANINQPPSATGGASITATQSDNVQGTITVSPQQVPSSQKIVIDNPDGSVKMYDGEGNLLNDNSKWNFTTTHRANQGKK